MDEAGLPSSPLNTIDKVVEDPNLQHRDMVVEVEQPRAGKVKMAGSPYHLTETPGKVFSPAPLLGQHTKEFLQEELGYTADDVDSLLERKVVFSV
jgi:CoA:oxalate CoA-transferase